MKRIPPKAYGFRGFFISKPPPLSFLPHKHIDTCNLLEIKLTIMPYYFSCCILRAAEFHIYQLFFDL